MNPKGGDVRSTQAKPRQRSGRITKRTGVRKSKGFPRIIKNRKPIEERSRNCDAQNSRLLEGIRREVMSEEGYDLFGECNANENLSLYSARNTSWRRVGILCPESGDSSYDQGGAPCVTKPDSCTARSNCTIYDLKFNERREVQKRVVYEVIKEAVDGTPDPVEVNAIFFAPYGHFDLERGQELVRDGARAAFRDRGEAIPTEVEFEFVALHLKRLLRERKNRQQIS